MKITVTTAITLSKSQLEALTKALKKKYGSKTSIETIVDEAVIGGIKVTAGSEQLDGTLKHKLNVIKTQLHQSS